VTANERPHILLREHAPPEQREYTGGGGGGTYPRTSYAEHASKVFKQAAELRAMFAKLNPGGPAIDRGYFRIEMPPDVSIKGTDGRKLEENTHTEIVGAPTGNVGHVSTTPESFALLLEQLEHYSETKQNVGKSKFAPIENIGPIPLEEKLGPGVAAQLESQAASIDVLLGLFPDLLSRERQAVLQAVEALVKEMGGQVASETEGESGTYIRVQASPAAVRKVAETLIAVQSVDQTEHVVALSARPGPAIAPSCILKPSDRAPLVCIIDSGVESGCRFIDPFVIARENPLGPPHAQGHGTFVASRALFGDSIRDQVAAGVFENRVRVISVAAFARDGVGNMVNPTTEQLIRLIRDTVSRWHSRCKVYNLSMNLVARGGTSNAPTANTISPLAAEIDALSRRYGVLFVISSGNYPSPNAPTPVEAYPEYFNSDDTRVLGPGEAMLALTVGSCAERANSGSMATQGQPSPFTRRGPGFNDYRKPDLVAHGGNYGTGWSHHDDLAVAGLGSTGDALSYGNGTSFAAPVVTSLAAQILDSVPNATVELVRALLVHFAEFSDDARESELLSNLIGNGRPAPPRILHSTPWEQTYAFMGLVDFRQILKIPFFVPAALASRRMRNRLRVRCTVAFAPETNRTLRAGYCKSHLRCKLIKVADDGQLKEVTGEDSPEAIKARYSSVVRLEKTFSSHIRGGDWHLLIEQESRWRLKDPKTPLAAVITVEDPTRASGVDIHGMIRAEAQGRYQHELGAQYRLRL
jgi:hypothetical protein